MHNDIAGYLYWSYRAYGLWGVGTASPTENRKRDNPLLMTEIVTVRDASHTSLVHDRSAARCAAIG